MAGPANSASQTPSSFEVSAGPAARQNWPISCGRAYRDLQGTLSSHTICWTRCQANLGPEETKLYVNFLTAVRGAPVGEAEVQSMTPAAIKNVDRASLCLATAKTLVFALRVKAQLSSHNQAERCESCLLS